MPASSPEEHFPLASQKGADDSDVDRSHLRNLALQSEPITSSEFQSLLDEHKKFIKAGGGGGTWQTMNINGVIIGIYAGPKIHQGAQAVLNNRRLELLTLSNQSLIYSNLVGILAEHQNWAGININHSLITDAMCEGTNFEGASCIGTDFSRSDLRNCNFRNSNLKYADFENCNLEGADFTGANLSHSRFPGANLNNTTY